jgi:hypothetical protein
MEQNPYESPRETNSPHETPRPARSISPIVWLFSLVLLWPITQWIYILYLMYGQ